MGIHFVCHNCSYALHVKDFQAGKRGKCPNCRGSFRIPANDSSYSSPVEDVAESSAVANLRSAFELANQTTNAKLDDLHLDSVAIALERNSKDEEAAEDSPKTHDVKMPAAFTESSDAKWFVRPPSGGQFGPAPSKLVMAWISESRVTAESYLWREGFADWQLASELVPELFPAAEGPMSEPPREKDFLSVDSSILPPDTDLKLNSEIATRAGLILKKQMQKRRQQLIMIVFLAFVSLVLFGILIFVLVFQANKSTQPNAMHHKYLIYSSLNTCALHYLGPSFAVVR